MSKGLTGNGDTTNNRFCAGADPTSTFSGAISVVFGIQVSLRVHYCKRVQEYFTTLLWQKNWRQNGLTKTAKVSAFKSVFVRSSPVVMNLKWRLKECWQKNRLQRWDICEDSTVWHFVARSTDLKSVKPGMSRHFSESRDPSCVSSAMYIQNVPGENSELSPLG